eukprot:c16737_g1_i1 orf=94-807(+)
MMISVSRAPHLSQMSSIESSVPFTGREGTVHSLNFAGSQIFRSFKLRSSPQRLHAKQGQLVKWGAIACATSAEGADHGGQNVQAMATALFRRGFAQLESYPWDKFSTKLMQHLAEAVWFVGKWVAVPALILTALRDVYLTVLTANELCIPIGLLVGTILTGILKEACSTLGMDFQHNVLPWHLVELGLFFVIVKACALKGPLWFQAFLLHFTTGGLWQTIRFSLDWKARKEEPAASL